MEFDTIPIRYRWNFLSISENSNTSSHSFPSRSYLDDGSLQNATWVLVSGRCSSFLPRGMVAKTVMRGGNVAYILVKCVLCTISLQLKLPHKTPINSVSPHIKGSANNGTFVNRKGIIR